MSKRAFWLIGVVGMVLAAPLLAAPPVGKNVPAKPVATAAYDWTSVAWGGGSVTGIALHPAAPRVFLRTDMGTGYRWNALSRAWEAVLDNVSYDAPDLYGPESVALDPSDKTGNTVFYALGRYAQDWARPAYGDLTKSSDGGKTWRRAGLKLSIASNTDQVFGERLAVDPVSHGKRVVYASRGEGLWISDGAGEPKTWRRDANAPVGDLANRRERGASGLTFFVFNAAGGETNGLCREAFMGAWNAGVYQTTDAGKTWVLIGDSPKHAHRAAVTKNGTLFVTAENGVFRRGKNEAGFTNITPDEFAGKSFVAVAVGDAGLMVAAHDWKFHQPLFRSTDNGKSWTRFDYKDIVRDFGDVSYFARREWLWAGAPSALAFDPRRANAAYMTDWSGPWYCADVTTAKPHWKLLMRGHEQGVTLILKSLPRGAPLLAGAMDADGYRFADLKSYPSGAFSDFGVGGTNETTGIDFCEADPDYVVRIGANTWSADGGGKACFSTDNARTWREFAATPAGAWGGQVAVSATNPQNIVWLPAQGKKPFFTADGGKTWREAEGAPHGAIPGDKVMFWNVCLQSDRVQPGVFYLLHGGTVYRSADAGKSWSPQNTASPLPATETTGFRLLRAAPESAGELWVSLDTKGLWHSADGGKTWARIPGVERSYLFACGKPLPGSIHAALYVLGEVAGRRGLFRSDNGAAWTPISDDRIQFGAANTLEADRQTAGRVYVGTNGRGIYVGTPKL